jgi:SulP family sulfate permease
MAPSFLRKLRALAPAPADVKADAMAGLTFAVVAVPQAMGHALLATVNPVAGIFTLMVAVPVAALTTGSVFMNVSTTAAGSVVTGAELAAVAPDQRLAALGALVLLVGAIQLLAGVLRAGSLLRFVSDPVMTGFLNGVAVLIVLGQLGELTGYRSTHSSAVARALDLLLRLDRIDVRTTIIGALALGAIVLLLRTRLSKFAFVIAVAAATTALAVLSLPGLDPGQVWHSVRIVRDVSSIPRALPSLSLPDPGMLLHMLVPAMSVAIIGLVQGAGVSQAYTNPDGRYPDVSRDFLGQGAANVATAFAGGLPAGGSISGTVLIIGAGARSRWTNVFGGAFVAIIVLLAAPLAELVPMPALAALLIVAGFQGLRVEPALTAWRTGRVPAAAMVLTFLGTLFLPLHFAVLLGVAFTFVLHATRESKRTNLSQIVLVPGGMPEIRPVPPEAPSNQVTVLIVNGSLFFATAKSVGDMLPAVGSSSRAVVVLALRGKTDLGSTFIAVLRRYALALQARDGMLMLAGVEARAREQLARTGLLTIIGEENVFPPTEQLGAAVNHAVAAAHAWLARAPSVEAP